MLLVKCLLTVASALGASEAVDADPFLAVPRDQLYYKNLCGITSVSVAIYSMTGEYLPPAELAKACTISDRGISMAAVEALLEKNGILGSPMKAQLADLIRMLDSTFPSAAICLMDKNHWVALCRSTSGDWLMVDYPYKGRIVDFEEFGKHYEGLAVIASTSTPRVDGSSIAVLLSGSFWLFAGMMFCFFHRATRVHSS